MKTFPGLIFSFGIFLSSYSARAQEGNVWAFGDLAGVDFNNNPPTAIKTSISTKEGSASICDDKGKLLFYTDGFTIWNRNHDIMPNGNELTGADIGNITSSTTQGTIIVPVPGQPLKYYIFSLGDFESEPKGYFGKLLYSMVDISLDGGLGDVLPGYKGLLLDSLLTEHMMAVSGEDCNIWLVVASRTMQAFKAYNITDSGISRNPVLSPRLPGRGSNQDAIGSIDISPDRSKLAIAQESNVVLYDFDVISGKISQPVVLEDMGPTGSYYSVCFSPGSTKIYAGTYTILHQFDLSLNDSLLIANSKIAIAYNTGVHSLKRGPDGKVYFSGMGTALNAIHQPDQPGLACDLVYRSLVLAPGTRSRLGLPNIATVIKERQFYNTETDTLPCRDGLVLKARHTSGSNYVWDDGSTRATRAVAEAGIYRVRYQVNSPCILDHYVDSFVIYDFKRKAVATTEIAFGFCNADTLLMKAMDTSGAYYTWEDGSAGKERRINRTGIYWVKYTLDSLCEDRVDSFVINYPKDDYRVSFIVDSLICLGDSVQFQNTSHPYFREFLWSFGDANTTGTEHPAHTYRGSGRYEVMLVGKIAGRCTDTAYQSIIVDSPLAVNFFMQPNRICTGTSVAFAPTINTASLTGLTWEFGDGKELLSIDPKIRHAYDIAGTMPVTLTARFRACPERSFTDTVYVHALPDVYLGADTSLCFQEGSLTLNNRHLPLSEEPLYYLWNTKDTTPFLQVTHPGIYSLTVISGPLSCSNTETITIGRNCYLDIPNAFTPNGDGTNDYFFPRQLLSEGITRFSMKVFNRQGQLLFETLRTNGMGWDGRSRGVHQPTGVYIYRIEAEFNGHFREEYIGNVTLIR